MSGDQAVRLRGGGGAQALVGDPLRLIRTLRFVSLACQAVVVLVVSTGLGVELPRGPLVAVILAGLAFNLWPRPAAAPPGDTLVIGELVFDIAQLGALLALSGAATNPFAALLLLPVVIAAASRPGGPCWTVALAALGCYTVLLLATPSLPALRGGGGFDLHVLGMWLGFVISVVVVSVFVAGLGRALERQREALEAARERAASGEKLVALGALAASAAHELNTPLNTLALLADELAEEAGEGQARVIAAELAVQVERCRAALRSLAASAGQVAAGGGAPRPLDRYLAELLAEYRRTRPGVRLRAACGGPRPAPVVVADATLGGVLVSLLDNAARVSPAEVVCDARWDEEALRVEVRDRGPGLSRTAREVAGTRPYSERPGGLGLGLYMTRLVLERLGGRLELDSCPGSGARTRVCLPLAPIRVPG